MAYVVNGEDLGTDEQGFLLAPDYRDAVVRAIASAEGIALTEKLGSDSNFAAARRAAGQQALSNGSANLESDPNFSYLRDQYREHGHTPNFRNMLKDLGEVLPGCDSKSLYALFPTGPAKQGAKVAGLPQPLGKGGY
jgi:tRNA 2-thiouridine synthesizing protein E